jgi:hypothetical protein
LHKFKDFKNIKFYKLSLRLNILPKVIDVNVSGKLSTDLLKLSPKVIDFSVLGKFKNPLGKFKNPLGKFPLR